MNAFYSTAVLALVAGQPAVRPSVLVLDDYKLVEGQVSEIPDYHDPSGETKLFRVASSGPLRTIPAKGVLFQGATRQEAYRFVKGKWNPTTVDGHLKLAEWCRDAGLVDEALTEAKAAAMEGPPDAYLTKLLRELETAKAKRPEDGTVRIVRPVPAPVEKSATGPPVKPAEASGVDPQLEKYFGRKVQPILMNQCVSCHADPNRATKFVLSRVPEGETAGVTTARNLASTLARVSGETPGQSALLVFAAGPHGGQKQAALSVNHPAYMTLSAWVIAAAAGRPGPPSEAKAVSFAAGPVERPAKPTTPAPNPPAPALAPKIKLTLGPDPADAFDPAEFNKPGPPAKKP